MTPAARWSHGELGDLLVVAVLGVGEGEAAVDLEGLAAGVPAVGLDEGVVDALGFQPGEQEVPQLVGGDGFGEPGRGGVAGEQGAHAAGAVGPFPAGLEEVVAAGGAAATNVEGRGSRGRWPGKGRCGLCRFALADAYPAGVEVDVVEADRDQLAD